MANCSEMTPDEFNRRKREVIDQERRNVAGWFYLSFADERGFLGAVFVQGQGPVTAADRAHRLGINPGGQVACWQINDEGMALVPASDREKLLSRNRLEELFGDLDLPF